MAQQTSKGGETNLSLPIDTWTCRRLLEVAKLPLQATLENEVNAFVENSKSHKAVNTP